MLALARAPVVLVLLAGFACSVAFAGYTLRAELMRGGALPVMAGLLAASLPFVAAIALARRRAPVPPWIFVTCALLGGTLLRVAYVTWFDPAWVSDFAQYWNTGVDLASRDAPNVRTIYDQRALFLSTPVVWLFGESRAALEGYNVLLAAVVQLAGYDIARRSAGHQAAQAFTVLWLGAAEPLLVLALPNHDLLALVFTAAGAWASVATIVGAGRTARPWSALLAGAFAGVCVALLEAVRGVGAIYLLTFVLVCGAAGVVLVLRTGWRHAALPGIALHLLAFVAAFALVQAAMARGGLVMQARSAELMTLRYTTSHATTLSDGTYRRMRAFHDALAIDLMDDPEAFADFRRALVLSDFANAPFERLLASARRMPGQYALGSQLWFYLAQQPPGTVRAARIYNACYLGLFGACFVVAALRLLRRPAERPALGALLLLGSAFSLTLLLIGENQPRYMFALWFIGALAIGAGFARRGVDAAAPASLVSVLVVPVAGLLALVALAGGLLHLAYGVDDGRIPNRWEFAGDLAQTPDYLAGLQSRTSSLLRTPGTDDAMPLAFGALSLKLALAAPPARSQRAEATTLVCGLDPGRWLGFQYDAPAKHLQRRNVFVLEATQDGEVLWRSPLPNGDAVARVQVPLRAAGADGCSRIGFALTTTMTFYDRPSWQDASFVEIFFPRLTAVPPFADRSAAATP